VINAKQRAMHMAVFKTAGVVQISGHYKLIRSGAVEKQGIGRSESPD
jgi:hypothetical protein